MPAFISQQQRGNTSITIGLTNLSLVKGVRPHASINDHGTSIVLGRSYLICMSEGSRATLIICLGAVPSSTRVEHIFERKRPRFTGAKAGTHHEVEQYLVAWIGIQGKAYLDLILGQNLVKRFRSRTITETFVLSAPGRAI